MPEGPELYYMSQLLKKNINNQYFINIENNTKSIVKLPEKSKIINVYSFGKNLIINTENYNVVIHFGITGWLTLEKPKIYKYILEFEKIKYYLKDTRRFSKIIILKNNELLNEYINEYGVDILSEKFTYEYFYKIIKSKKKLLCNLLLDQKYFAGLGNYIKNEAFYLTKININKKSNELNDNQIKELYNNIKFVSYSKTLTLLEENNLTIPNKMKKNAPNKLEIPYVYNVYEKEFDKYGNKVILIKNHCGRRTYYVEQLQNN